MSKQSEQIRRRQQRVLVFRDGLVDLLNICERVENYLGNDRWQPKLGREAEAERRANDLQRLTHPAAVVVQECGGIVDFKPAGTWQTRPMNPVLVWATLFRDPLIDATLIVNSCDLTIGALDVEAEDAEAHEATAVGRIETSLDGPRGIWRALRGAPRDVQAHRSVAWIGFVGGIVAAVIAGGILHLLGWA